MSNPGKQQAALEQSTHAQNRIASAQGKSAEQAEKLVGEIALLSEKIEKQHVDNVKSQKYMLAATIIMAIATFVIAIGTLVIAYKP